MPPPKRSPVIPEGNGPQEGCGRGSTKSSDTVCCSAEPYGDEVQTIVRRLLTDNDIAVKGFDNVNQTEE